MNETNMMKRGYIIMCFCLLASVMMLANEVNTFPKIVETETKGYFPLSEADIYTDINDYRVVEITAGMLADDICRVTGNRPRQKMVSNRKSLPSHATVVAGTLGHSQLIDWLVSKQKINVSDIRGKWESYIILTTQHPKYHTPILAVIGSDRRGTAFGLTSLSEAIGVSPWYWWADVSPMLRSALYVQPCMFRQGEPSVQYRGIFINDERFGGWARWAEQTFDKETGQVGPKTYRMVFELLLRLKANYLWPAMHNGSKAFNATPENAQMADDYAIVMGSSHCEQMLRNNEDEWKNAGIYGDFNYITNRQTMINYWEERVKTNGKYENTYTLGLRGIHDYPMEGANTTEERIALMQRAIDDQRDILRRNIDKPVEQVPQVLCTYEEVLDAYHHGLNVPEDVTLLWSDDKQGYCRNLCNPQEQQRKGGAGIYYHLSYHGDPASWIWLSPLSPAFLSTELTKAYTFGARKIWVFNVGDIKPAEKEISFVMDLAWDINRWKPEHAHDYIRYWATKTFGSLLAKDIADIQAGYYQLQAAGKDAHVWFIKYSQEQIAQRITQWRQLIEKAETVGRLVPDELKDAYFELILYPVRGAGMLNEYQLLARRSMVRTTFGDSIGSMADANRVKEMFNELNQWTYHYNHEILHGKWENFFNWQPYHWFRSEKIDPPISTPELFTQTRQSAKPRFLSVTDALSVQGVTINSETECTIPIWIEALTPIRNFSKAPEDNMFCDVVIGNQSFHASATPINNVWHAPYVGPMWSRVGELHLKKDNNQLFIKNLHAKARIDKIFIGLYPPFVKAPRISIPAYAYHDKHDSGEGHIMRIPQLGYSDGMMVLPFDTPSYQESDINSAPYIEYALDIQEQDSVIEIRTLPTLHVYEGRDARYAVQLGNEKPIVFSIHADDFSAEWRWNVLRGYASRSINIPPSCRGSQKLKVFFLDPGVVLEEVSLSPTLPQGKGVAY